MKNILWFVFSVLILMGCSSDDDKENLDFTFNKSEIVVETSWLTNGGYYYLKDGSGLVIAVSKEKVKYSEDENRYVAGDAVCPIHQNHNLSIVQTLPPKMRAAFYCHKGSNIAYDAFDGTPVAPESGKHKHKIYNISYNEDTEEFHIWK